MSKKLRVGITVLIDPANESLFINGIKQNVIALYDLISKCRNVEAAYFIDLSNSVNIDQSHWKKYKQNIISFDQALETNNLIISAGAKITDEEYIAIKKKNIKLIKYAMGSEYHMLNENIIFNLKDRLKTYEKRELDAVWTTPHLYEANKDLFEITYKTKAYSAPFIWKPEHITGAYQELKANSKLNKPNGLYEPNNKKEKQFSVLEPNINYIKTCITPIIAAEKLFNRCPEIIDCFNVFCTDTIRSNPVFSEFAGNLNINKNKKIFFENKYNVVYSLLQHTDVVVSHQVNLELNYLYFDACWMGFPLIHNSRTIKGLGFYYEGYNADQAVDNMIFVAKNFDNMHSEYLLKSREFISSYLPDNIDNINKYEQLLDKI